MRHVTRLAPGFPDEAVAMLLWVCPPGVATVPASAREAVVRGWLSRADPGRFDGTWDALARLSGSRVSDLPASVRDTELLIGALRDAVREAGPEWVSVDFRRGASRRLQQRLARRVSVAADSVAFELFELVALSDDGGCPAVYWQCVLGDRARECGDLDEAIRRYQAALHGRVAQARPRLAYVHALKGYQLLRRGEFRLALTHLRTAESLTADPDYRLLSLLGRLFEQPASAAGIVSELIRLRDELSVPAVADFWIGVAQLESGDPVAAAVALRRSVGATPGAAGRPAPDATERNPPDRDRMATLLLHIAEGGANGLVAFSRELLHRHAERWAQRSPIPSDTVVADVADRDPGLLSRLVSALPDQRQLSSSTRMIAAHAMLSSAVQASEAGIALNRVEVAERLLRGG
ncbi:MAG: tetratricopeptide repeat protein [Pseudonocardiaceae bacterium]